MARLGGACQTDYIGRTDPNPMLDAWGAKQAAAFALREAQMNSGQFLRFWSDDWSWMHEDRMPVGCEGGIRLEVPAHWTDVEIELHVSPDPFHYAVDHHVPAAGASTPRIVLAEHELPY